jgi:CheY-like chemotaxis protein
MAPLWRPRPEKTMPRILVVDDEPKFAQLIRRMLETWGYSVDLAAGGRDAVARVKKTEYALATVDLFMPDWDGLEVARTIHLARPEVPMVVVSAAAREHYQAKLESLPGIRGWFGKPVEIDGFMNFVREVAGPPEKKSVPQPPVSGTPPVEPPS